MLPLTAPCPRNALHPAGRSNLGASGSVRSAELFGRSPGRVGSRAPLPSYSGRAAPRC